MRVLLACAVVALLTLVVGGCADDDLSVMAGEELQAHVTALQEAVAAGDAEGAHGKLAELRAALAEYEEQGDVSPERAASIREAANEVAELLALLPEEESETVAAEEEPADEEDDTATGDASSDGGGRSSGGGGNGGGGGGPDRTPPGHGGDPPGQNRGGGGR